MTLANARALLPNATVHVDEHDEPRERRALAALAAWALRFSPIVGADPPDGLLLDIDGCQRLFHGERRLVNVVANSVQWLGFAARVAVAETYGCAWAVARFGTEPRTIVAAGREREAIAPLPVEALRIEGKTTLALREVGIDVVGHLFDLNRRELVTRFGADLLMRLDQAIGEAAEVIEPVRPVEVPSVRREFDGPVKDLQAIALTVDAIVIELVEELARRESGVRTLEMKLERIDAATVSETIELSRPSRSIRHLRSLLRSRVEAANLGFGVEAVEFRAAAVGRLRHEQSSNAWGDGGDASSDRSLGELLDTLAERLGADRTAMARPVESHVPERAFELRRIASTAAAADDAASTSAITASERPSSLFDRPEPIEVIALTPDGPPSWIRWRETARSIVTSFGPERIGGEWWRSREKRESRAAETRDYFKVQDEIGQWLWMYRELESGRWFMHGQWA